MSHDHDHVHHDVGYKEPILVFLALVFLTILTVWVAGRFDSAMTSLVVAFAIASVKAFFVVRYFMHLKYEDKVFFFFLLTALGTFAVVFILLFADYGYRW